MEKGLGLGEKLFWPRYLSVRLPGDIDPGAVFPLRAMGTNLVRRNPGPTDAPMCGPHESDCYPTLDVSTRPGVGLPPFFARRMAILSRLAVASTLALDIEAMYIVVC